jgi:hypothetical protein
MLKETNKITILLHGITLLVALVILIDFAFPGKVYTEEILNVDQERQQYSNAAGNHHYSYKVATAKHHFSVSEDFAKSAQDKKVTYSVSLIFQEINNYRLHSSDKSNIDSFRLASGLGLPLLVILTFLIAYKIKKRMSTLLFVLQIALLGNLVLLIL